MIVETIQDIVAVELFTFHLYSFAKLCSLHLHTQTSLLFPTKDYSYFLLLKSGGLLRSKGNPNKTRSRVNLDLIIELGYDMT